MAWEKDLVVVAADEDVLAIIKTIVMTRRESLRLRQIAADETDFRKDVLHDSSPPIVMATLLRPYLRTHHRAMVVRDLEGSGYTCAAALENDIRQAVEQNGWEKERVEVIVIEPEVEAWLRFHSAHLLRLVRKNKRLRSGPLPNFKQKLAASIEKHGGETDGKPKRPKEVFEDVLDVYHIPRSASLYKQLADSESLKDCAVPSFCKLVAALQEWFPATP